MKNTQNLNDGSNKLFLCYVVINYQTTPFNEHNKYLMQSCFTINVFGERKFYMA